MKYLFSLILSLCTIVSLSQISINKYFTVDGKESYNVQCNEHIIGKILPYQLNSTPQEDSLSIKNKEFYLYLDSKVFSSDELSEQVLDIINLYSSINMGESIYKMNLQLDPNISSEVMLTLNTTSAGICLEKSGRLKEISKKILLLGIGVAIIVALPATLPIGVAVSIAGITTFTSFVIDWHGDIEISKSGNYLNQVIPFNR